MQKLTAVTISGNGKKCQAFVMATMVDGKAIISRELLNKMLASIGVIYRGQTYTTG